MSNLSLSQQEALIDTTAERYRLDGYEVTIEPDPKAVPFDLGGYRPDMIASKGGVTTLVGVKSQPQKLSFDQLRSLVEEVKRHEGWRFVLVTGQDVAPTAMPGQDDTPFSRDDVTQRIEVAERLAGVGEREAGYLILWIALERTMRFHARRVALPVDRLAPGVLIRQLYSQGELTMAQFETALRCQEVRNQIVHGFRAPDLDVAYQELAALLHELVDEWLGPGASG
jgi:hypothetical protein